MRCGRSASRFGNAFSQGASMVTVRPHVKVRERGWRAYDEGQRRYHLKALGDFGTLPGRERFADAKKAAEAVALLVESGGQPAERIDTVEDTCRRYLETHPDVVGRVTCGIFSDPIASVKLTKLRRSHFQAWRQRPQQKPALVTRRKKGPQVTRPRAPSSINRELATLRAALNKVLTPGTPGTEAAWQEALRAIRNADRPAYPLSRSGSAAFAVAKDRSRSGAVHPATMPTAAASGRCGAPDRRRLRRANVGIEHRT